MQKITLQIWDIIKNQSISQTYQPGSGSFQQFLNSLAQQHNLPVEQLQLKSTSIDHQNILITNERDLIKHYETLVLDSPNPLPNPLRSNKSVKESSNKFAELIHQGQKKQSIKSSKHFLSSYKSLKSSNYKDSEINMVESIVISERDLNPPKDCVQMIDKEIQCSLITQQTQFSSPKNLDSLSSVNFGSTFSSLKMQITEEEVKQKLKEVILELTLSKLENIMLSEDIIQQDKVIDELRMQRITCLKEHEYEIERIQTKISEATSQLMQAKFETQEQQKEIDRILATKEDLNKQLQKKEQVRQQLMEQQLKPKTESEVKQEFYKMYWVISQKIKNISEFLKFKEIYDDEFSKQLQIINEKVESYKSKFDQELFTKILNKS